MIREAWFTIARVEPSDLDDIIEDVSPQPSRVVTTGWYNFPSCSSHYEIDVSLIIDELTSQNQELNTYCLKNAV